MMAAGSRAAPGGPAIRRATPAELNELILLERETPTAPHWPAADYRRILEEAASGESLRRVLLVAVLPEQDAKQGDFRVAGFAVVRVLGVEAEIESVVVRPGERRLGLGTALCRAAMDWARGEGAQEARLEVRARSAGAILLYGGLGFVASARRQGYYHDPPDDALLMHCALSGRKGHPLAEPSRPGAHDV